MGHTITAIILKSDFDHKKCKDFDLTPISLDFGLTLFQIDHYYSAYWQYILETSGHLEISNIDCAIFPKELAVFEILKRISNSAQISYAIILTDYFGGKGYQYANVFVNSDNADMGISSINQALKYLGVPCSNDNDEFTLLGLDKLRNQPDHLEKYKEIIEELGL